MDSQFAKSLPVGEVFYVDQFPCIVFEDDGFNFRFVKEESGEVVCSRVTRVGDESLSLPKGEYPEEAFNRSFQRAQDALKDKELNPVE